MLAGTVRWASSLVADAAAGGSAAARAGSMPPQAASAASSLRRRSRVTLGDPGRRPGGGEQRALSHQNVRQLIEPADQQAITSLPAKHRGGAFQKVGEPIRVVRLGRMPQCVVEQPLGRVPAARAPVQAGDGVGSFNGETPSHTASANKACSGTGRDRRGAVRSTRWPAPDGRVAAARPALR